MLIEPRADHWDTVASFYDQSWADVVGLWANEDNLALHWGYWDEQTRTHPESLINMNRKMARLAGVQRGDRVLDAGCGFGGTSFWLAEQCVAEVVGINISEGQLARAREIGAARGLNGRVSFERQDMLQTTFESESFDVVWAQESVDHAPDQRLFLREAHRLLKPGGRLVVEDRFRSHQSLSGDDAGLLRQFCESALMPTMPTRAEFAAWVSEAGFAPTHLLDITADCARSCRRFRAQTRITYPLARLLRRFGLRTDSQLEFLRGLRCEQELQKRGVLLIAVVVATKLPRPSSVRKS